MSAPSTLSDVFTTSTCPRCGRKGAAAFDSTGAPWLAAYEGACLSCVPLHAERQRLKKEAGF